MSPVIRYKWPRLYIYIYIICVCVCVCECVHIWFIYIYIKCVCMCLYTCVCTRMCTFCWIQGQLISEYMYYADYVNTDQHLCPSPDLSLHDGIPTYALKSHSTVQNCKFTLNPESAHMGVWNKLCDEQVFSSSLYCVMGGRRCATASWEC